MMRVLRAGLWVSSRGAGGVAYAAGAAIDPFIDYIFQPVTLMAMLFYCVSIRSILPIFAPVI
ncbi:hypothetical protein EPIR_3145 [Erwinia piriflorinigrans CFBP 5888]|uniref:Uncharacterized protein n=1 Tax=Erwinia piriflorinigrans CFBP 5888 TaxID=1161919 RepID=V5ZAX1_9GAMM|nr:hypothetical protein EPIR_3145 [Erwinia piriflorinigrans CFBP 5888]